MIVWLLSKLITREVIAIAIVALESAGVAIVAPALDALWSLVPEPSWSWVW